MLQSISLFRPSMVEKANSIFSTIRIEDGNQVIDIEEELDKYDLLSLLFHRETIPIDTSKVVVAVKADNRRYFGDTTLCYKCWEIGHMSRDCTQEHLRRCSYCGILHTRKPCDFIMCDNCWNLGHTQRLCRERLRKSRECTRCPKQIHSEDMCPRIWRKYSLVNTNVRRDMIMSCPLCMSTSHFIGDCKDNYTSFTIFTKNYADLVEKDNK